MVLRVGVKFDEVAFRKKVNRRVDQLGMDAMRFVARRTFEKIYTRWPTDTFWSQANHKINIGGGEIRALAPSERPKEKGALSSKAASNRSTQLSKLESLQPGSRRRRIVLGNAVPYARNVGHSANNGALIYTESAQAAISELRSANFTRGITRRS